MSCKRGTVHATVTPSHFSHVTVSLTVQFQNTGVFGYINVH